METVPEANDCLVLPLRGRIDANVASGLEQQLLKHINDGHGALVVDLQEVTFISSAGLRALLFALKQTKKKGGDLRLSGLQSRVLEVFEMTGFTTVFKVYATADDAARSFGA